MNSKRADYSSKPSIRKTHLGPSVYDIYCINFYDNGLSAVRDEFIHQIKLGLRRFLFVIDLENEIIAAKSCNEMNTRLSKAKKPDFLPTDPVDLTLLRIEDCLQEYELVSRKIDLEQNFNLLKYWQKNVPADLKIRVLNPNKSKKDNNENGSNRGKVASKQSKDTTDSVRVGKIVCFGVTAKEHNTVGKGQRLSKRMYIADQPPNTPVMILIIGNFDNDFYKTLLTHNQPLRGITHFFPEECTYDILVPQLRRKKYLREIIEKTQRDIFSLCKRVSTKTVGIFQQQIPQMSICQATKFANNIFDQLSWFIYDVQILRDQFYEYYVNSYKEIDIKMNFGANMQDSLQLAKSISIQGHYLNAEMPVVHDDDGSLYLYIEALMCTFGNPRELMTEIEVLLLANPSSAVQTKVLDKVKVYANAFKSIIKLIKCERLFIEQANPLLTSVISNMDQKLMRNIYHACLEYNILRRYFSSGYITESLHYTSYCENEEPKYLPKFAKLYLTDDSVTQRIIQLINENENYKIQEVYPNIKLYTFKRCFNEVIEHKSQIVIPTRLCFRDFTLHEMPQFLQDLVTPNMFDDGIDFKANTLSQFPSVFSLPKSDNGLNSYNCRSNQRYSITPSIFLRPKSLKASKVAEQQKEKAERLSSRISRQKNDTSRINPKSERGQSVQSHTIDNETSSSSGVKIDSETGKSRPTYIGLGPNHTMLTGYNLDDTRQTINVKTSKYFFDEGLITLYEEKWNFRQMNICLSIEIEKQIIHLTNDSQKMTTISSNVRFQTPHGISLRINPISEECVKAVLNYPNGLSLYCHDTHAEHLWSGHQSELNECRRICTPYGCVIVLYNNNDTILIMRYNGEVYRLYSYVYPILEEEGEFEESTEFVNACTTQSTYSSYKPLHTRESSTVKQKRTQGGKSSSQTKRTKGGTDKHYKKTSQVESGSRTSQTLVDRVAKVDTTMQLNQTAALFNSIEAELSYLNFIIQLFNLSYKHLKLTTALGSVVHVENNDKIYCGKPIRVTEWHDYYANESYAMRDDGVKMIWTQNDLRCYHSDGTVISSTTVEGWDPGVLEDDIDKEISSSSSHITKVNKKHSESTDSNIIYVNIPHSDSFNEIYPNIKDSIKVKDNAINEFLQEVESEEQDIYDYSFTTYIANSYLMQHKMYAGTQFIFSHINAVDFKMETKVFAADNLQFHISHLCSHGLHHIKVDTNISNDEENVSSEADPDEWTRKPESILSPLIQLQSVDIPVVTITASNLNVSVCKDRIEIAAKLRKFGCDENVLVVHDNVVLQADLTQNITAAFQKWVDAFRTFINCSCPKWRTTYFVESVTGDCRKKGFELYKNVPGLGKFKFCAGNYFIDPEELKSSDVHMTHNDPFYEKNMFKFPRFPQHEKSPKIVNFPSILTTKVFVEIPAQLAYTDRIHLFINPFDKIKFRKLKHRFNEAVLFHLHPRLRTLVNQEISKRSWRNHHIDNARRLFMEQQRLSLYIAMLKHKVYPNYFQFKDQFYSHVRNIEFFEFMASKCNEKDNPERYIELKLQDGDAKEMLNKESANAQKGRKKCFCPKYVSSLK